MNATSTTTKVTPGARALVLGLGRTGLSCARFLRRNGVDVRVADTRERPPGFERLQRELPDVELRTGPFAAALLENASQVVVSPGLSVREPVVVEARRRGLPVVGDIELFARALPADQKVLAITGTNGKTTVASLTGALTRAAGLAPIVAGNIGNAVNLTDGLDGLAIMPAVMVGAALGIFAYATGNVNFAAYLSIPYISGAGELLVFCGALTGAGLGFLWFNAYPAQVFMGDIGALALGAALGVVAVIVRLEIVLFVMGGVFVMETVSVILQVASFKLRGKRIFKMAPIHHHFELKGWAEPKVIVRFWIITVILVLVGLATLKLR